MARWVATPSTWASPKPGHSGLRVSAAPSRDSPPFVHVVSSPAVGLVDPGSHGKVVLAHKHYIEAGARVVTTNNFGCNPNYFGKACAQQGWDPNDTTKHIVKYTKVAGDLARQAIKECGVPGVKLLGSLPCIWESHRPDQTDDFFREKGEEYIEDLYRQIAKALGEVDAFLCETMNTEQEAACAVRACRDLGKPIWVSFEPTFRGERLAPRCEVWGRELEPQC